ncbi:MAG: glycosyltransferase family 2 protein, partial [Acidimicrobiales bacterium]
MAERTRVDVGVVTWNTSELTARALRNLLDTDQGCDIRVLVHDNGSSDGTPSKLAQAVPEALVEAYPDNLGFAAAMNRLLAR